MTQNTWHTIREGACTTVARRLPARFDVSADAHFPKVGAARLAHQIRQDLWRSLQKLRGFTPVVRVEAGDHGLLVTAGGQMSGRIAAGVQDNIAALLADEARRARWIKCAAKGQGGA